MHVFVTVSFMRYSIDHARLLSCGPATLVSEISVVVLVLGVSAYVSFGVGSSSIVSSLFSKIISQCVTPNRFRLCCNLFRRAPSGSDHPTGITTMLPTTCLTPVRYDSIVLPWPRFSSLSAVRLFLPVVTHPQTGTPKSAPLRQPVAVLLKFVSS